MNYRLKLLLAISAVSIIMLVILMTNRITMIDNIMHERNQLHIDSLGNLITDDISIHLAENRIGRIRDALKIADLLPDVEFISVIDNNGFVIYSSDITQENKNSIH